MFVGYAISRKDIVTNVMAGVCIESKAVDVAFSQEREDRKYVLAKFNLPSSASLRLKDSSNVEVDADIFDELLKSSGVSFKAEECDGINAEEEFSEGSSLSDWSPSSCASQGSSSGSDTTLILESTKARKRQLVEGSLDSNVARDVS
ncbi:uncharacterized protein V6R79_020104 [Siganus canaliculatus]